MHPRFPASTRQVHVPIHQAGNDSPALQVADFHLERARWIDPVLPGPKQSLSSHQQMADAPGVGVVKVGVEQQLHRGSRLGFG